LLVSIAADEVWVLDAYLRTDGATGGDIKVAVKGPTGVSGHFMVLGPGTTATTFENATANNQIWPVSPTPTGLPAGTLGAGNDTLVHVHAVIRNGSTAGSVVIQWAQNTSSGTATKVLTNSYLVAQREDQTASLIAGWSPILDYKSTTDTPDDEFDSTTGSSGTVNLLETGEVQKYDLATRPGWLLMQAGSAANQKVELRQDFTLGDGESIIAAISPVTSSEGETGMVNNELWVGIGLNDNDTGYDAGEWNVLMFDVNTEGWRLVHWDGTTGHGSTGTTTDSYGSPIAELIYLRLLRNGSNIHAFWSHDGSSWMSLNSETRSATATNIWLFCESLVAASEPVPIVAVDWIRQGGNGLDPWSSSGLVQLDTVPEHILYLAGRRPDETPSAADDFFDGASLDSAWTGLTVTGSQTITQKYGKLSVEIDGTIAVSDFNALLKSVTPSFGDVIEARIGPVMSSEVNDFIFPGIVFSDGTTASSNIAIFGAFKRFIAGDSTENWGWWLSTRDGTFTAANADTAGADDAILAPPDAIYLRLEYDATNSYKAFVSPDGVSWIQVGAAFTTPAFTPTHVGLCWSNWGQTADLTVVSFDYFRYN
jgi:hypothetical protein